MVQKIFDRCCGCGACASICPVGAIELAPDTDGFYKPHVKDNCTHCGACLKACPVQTPPEGEQPKAFYACAASPERIMVSSSGGVFSLLAEKILEQDGAVFGCGWEGTQPRHRLVADEKALCSLYGSKYAQSDMGGIYKEVKRHLQAERKVLFSGTPCQVAGLRRYLKKNYDNLIAVDFICHGVPSPKVLKKYLTELETKQGAKISKLTFRDKSKGWKELQLTVWFEDGSEYSCPAGKDPYYRAFLSNLSLNKICGDCPFNTLPRSADITLGDFWRVEKHHQGFEENQGVSCVVVNTEKGAGLFEAVRNELTVVKSSREDIMDGNPFLNGHCTLHKRRGKFFAGLDGQPLDELAEDCLKLTKLEWAKEILAYKLGRTKHG